MSAGKTILKSGIRGVCALMSLLVPKRRPENPRRILILAGGYLGDTFWAVQTVPLLREAYPEAEIHLAGRPFVRDLARGILPEERIHDAAILSDRTRESYSLRAMSRNALALRTKLRPDLVVDLMSNRYSAWFCFRLGAYSVGLDIAGEASPLYSYLAKLERTPSRHLLCRTCSTVNQFLGRPDSPDATPFPPAPAKTKAEIFAGLKLDESRDVVMLIPGAGWSAKRWPPEKFHELAARLAANGVQVVLSGAPEEAELCRTIADGVPGAVIITGSLSDTFSLLPHCRAVAGNDSGVAHVAAAFGVPTVTLFCQTNPDFCAPLGPRSRFLRTSCPLSPGERDHYCALFPALTCDRPERMDFSVQQVLDAICRP